MVLNMYVDASTNGFDSCVCFIIDGGSYKKGLTKQTFVSERKSIQLMEYDAIIKLLNFLKENQPSKKQQKVIWTDSLQVFKEINFIQPSSYETLKLLEQVLILKAYIPNLKIEKINRKDNLAGIYLEKRLDKIKKSVNGKTINRGFKK